jgi:hypothetical protein
MLGLKTVSGLLSIGTSLIVDKLAIVSTRLVGLTLQSDHYLIAKGTLPVVDWMQKGIIPL